MNDYEEIYHDLQSNHLYAMFVVNDKDVLGVEVRCPALQSDSRLALVESLIPDTMKAEFFPNEEIIYVKKV